jgi:hypothetical protein
MSFLGVCMALAVVAASAYYYFCYNVEHKKEQPLISLSNKEPTSVAVNDDVKHKEKEVKQPIANQKKGTRKPPASKKQQKTVTIRDPRFIRRFAGHHSEPILDMSISPNGEWLATCGLDSKVRVTNTNVNVHGNDQQPITLSTNVNADANKYNQGNNCLGNIAWSPDNRTLVGAVVNSGELAFFRIRKKKDETTAAAAATNKAKSPLELIELTKRRFATTDTKININSCVVDHSHSNFLLALTSCDDPTSSHGSNVTVAWDGDNGKSLGSANLGNIILSSTNSMTTTTSNNRSPNIRLSPDGRFLCRGNFSPQVKMFEVQKKKTKGEINPVFDRISPKGVMTLVVGHAVADVCYISTSNVDASTTGMVFAVVCCTNGWIQVWDLNVEYKLREDPKRVCEYQIDLNNDAAGNCDEILTHVAASHQRIAVVTTKGSLHVLTYHTDTAAGASDTDSSSCSLVLDFTIDRTHDEQQQRRVADVQFGPSGDVVYTRAENSKDVFAWRV